MRCEIDQALLIGRSQRIFIGHQALAAQAQSAALLFNIALIRCQNLNLLLHLRHRIALRIGGRLRCAQSLFQFWKSVALLFQLRRQKR